MQWSGTLNEWLTPSGKDSYVVDGHRVYEGDVHIQITLRYGLGATVATFEVWLRNGVPIVTTDSIYWTNGGGQFAAREQGIRQDWLNDGYVSGVEYNDRSN